MISSLFISENDEIINNFRDLMPINLQNIAEIKATIGADNICITTPQDSQITVQKLNKLEIRVLCRPLYLR